MSHFYGTVKGGRGEATRCGHKNSGIVTHAASWRGAICVRVYHDAEGVDRYSVCQTTWQGSGINEELASGVIGVSSKEKHRAAVLAQEAMAARDRHDQCSKELPNEDDLIYAMSQYGGSFAKAIAKAWSVADLGNRRALRVSFGDLLETYRQFLPRRAA